MVAIERILLDKLCSYKIMERLEGQFAYCSGVSSEDMVHQLILQVEMLEMDHADAIITSDIDLAFDNISRQTIISNI